MKLKLKETLAKILSKFILQTWTTNYSTLGTIKAYKVAGVVTVDWQLATANLNKNQWTFLCTLPAEYRPDRNHNFVSYDNAASANWGTYAWVQTRVFADGKVGIWVMAGSDTNQIYGTVTYVVGGVLRNPVISRLTAIFTSLLFGGDVDEAVIETTAKEVDTRTNKDTKECVRLCGVHRSENGYADRRWNGQQSAGHKRWENSTILHADTVSITISERRWAA